MSEGVYSNQTAVCIIYAGGTFGCHGSPLMPLPWLVFKPALAQTLQQLQQQKSIANADYQLQAAKVIKDSSQLTPVDLALLYQQIFQQYVAGYQHIMLITGTDTLSYLAAFLAYAFAGSGLNLVLTAAMQPLLKPLDTPYQLNIRGDALANFTLGLAQVRRRQPSVSVAIAAKVFDAKYSQKIHTTDKNAFSGVELSASALKTSRNQLNKACYSGSDVKVSDAEVYAQWLIQRQHLVSQHIEQLKKVHIATCFAVPQMPEKLSQQLHSLLKTSPQGLLLVGYGAGNFLLNEAVKALLMQAYHQGCVVVQATQVPFGGCSVDYAAASWLQECHVLPGAQLSVAGIYARLLWLITAFAQHDNVAKMATIKQQWFALADDDIHPSHWH